MGIKINNFEINENSKTYIVAEISANHGHDINIAKKTIKAAKEVGANAVKIQTYTPDTLTIDCNNKYFKLTDGSIWDGITLYELYKKAYTPWEWHEELFNYAKEIGITLFSSPFDKSAVDLLDKLNTPAYKVASFEIFDIPLIEYIASKKKPIIISTGMATLSDIEEAVNTCKKIENNQIIILKCTSSYPARIEDANLKTIKNIRDTFNVIAGLSDHTQGITVPITSVALGAKFIEKHFILDKNIGGPDSSFSLDKDEFKQMVEAVRDTEKSIGKIDYDLIEKKEKNIKFARSLFFVKDIQKGEKITEENMRSIRPGYGLHPRYYNEILGKTVTQDIEQGTPVKWNLIK